MERMYRTIYNVLPFVVLKILFFVVKKINFFTEYHLLIYRINFEFKINLQKRRNSLNFNYHTKVKEVRHDRKRSD